MKLSAFLATISIAAAAAVPAIAGTIGSFDDTRTYSDYYLQGANYDDIRNAITADGHSVKAATSTASAAYLSDIDVFYTGMIDINSSAGGMATAGEIADLTAFVNSGGILVIGGENSSFTTNANSWLNPFGLNLSGSSVGGTWAAGPDPLLAGGVAGSALGFVAGSLFDAGTYDVLATASGGNAVVRAALGSGFIIGLGDGNFVDDPASAQSEQFFQNIMASTSVAPVPLPAALPMLLAALGGLGLVARRRNKIA